VSPPLPVPGYPATSIGDPLGFASRPEDVSFDVIFDCKRAEGDGILI